MKVAIIGSRNIHIPADELQKYLPEGTTEIVSGGAMGVDRSARDYAREHGLKLTEFLPDYKEHSRRAPLVRNIQIIRYSDMVLAFWDGKSNGTRYVICNCEELGTPVQVVMR